MALTRDDLKELAEVGLKEAKILLENNQYNVAYYLAGYVIECALKAVIAKQIRQYEFPNKKLANEVHVHNLQSLVSSSGLKLELDNEMRVNTDFEVNWSLVRQWSEVSRYERNTNEDAINIINAVADPEQGVFQWIKQRW